jgi:hypothetical protein
MPRRAKVEGSGTDAAVAMIHEVGLYTPFK